MPLKSPAINLHQPLLSRAYSEPRQTVFRKLAAVICLGAIVLITSCVAPPPVRAEQPIQQQSVFKNPYPVGTYEHFRARQDYLKTKENFKDYEVLERTNPDNSRIVVSLTTQRAQLMNGDEVAIDYAVSTGTANYPTPAGEYKIREMIVDKHSNEYGKIYDAAGNVVKSNANMPSDKGEIPEGGEYIGAAMPYWMRLTWSGIGMHVGNVPRYPASHACIRGQSHIMPIIYSKVKLLTPVSIVE
ncbi:MAG: L,D-transpeptidase family protein [Akkermansiaceae bacterium]